MLTRLSARSKRRSYSEAPLRRKGGGLTVRGKSSLCVATPQGVKEHTAPVSTEAMVETNKAPEHKGPQMIKRQSLQETSEVQGGVE